MNNTINLITRLYRPYFLNSEFSQQIPNSFTNRRRFRMYLNELLLHNKMNIAFPMRKLCINFVCLKKKTYKYIGNKTRRNKTYIMNSHY